MSNYPYDNNLNEITNFIYLGLIEGLAYFSYFPE
jgi:hypothetical protein